MNLRRVFRYPLHRIQRLVFPKMEIIVLMIIRMEMDQIMAVVIVKVKVREIRVARVRVMAAVTRVLQIVQMKIRKEI